MRLLALFVFVVTIHYAYPKTVHFELNHGVAGKSAMEDIAELYAEKMGSREFIEKAPLGKIMDNEECDEDNAIAAEPVLGCECDKLNIKIKHLEKKNGFLLKLIGGFLVMSGKDLLNHHLGDIFGGKNDEWVLGEHNDIIGITLKDRLKDIVGDFLGEDKKQLLELFLGLAGKDALNFFIDPKGHDLTTKVVDIIEGSKGDEFKNKLMDLLFKQAGKDLLHIVKYPKGLDVKKKFLKGLLGLLGKDILHFLKDPKGADERKKLKDLLLGLGGKDALEHFFKDPKGLDDKKKLLELLIGEAVKKMLLDFFGEHVKDSGPIGGKAEELHHLFDPLGLKDNPLEQLLHGPEGSHELKKLLDLLMGFKGKHALDHFLKDPKGMEEKKKFLKLLIGFAAKDALKFLKDPKGALGRKKIIHMFLGGAMKKLLFDFLGFDKKLLEKIMDPLGFKGEPLDKLLDPLGMKDKGGILGDLELGEVLDPLGIKGDQGDIKKGLFLAIKGAAMKKLLGEILGKDDKLGGILDPLGIKDIRKDFPLGAIDGKLEQKLDPLGIKVPVLKKILGEILKGDKLDDLFDPLGMEGDKLGLFLHILDPEGPIGKLLESLDANILKTILGKLFDKGGHDMFDKLLGPLGLDVKKKIFKLFLDFIGKDVMEFLKNPKGAEERDKLLDLLTGLGDKGAIEFFLKDPKGLGDKKKIMVLLFGEAIKKIMLHVFGMKDDPLLKLLDPMGLKGGIEQLLEPLLGLKGASDKKKIIDLILGLKGKDALEHFLKDPKELDLKGKLLKLLLVFAGKDAMDFLKDPEGTMSRKKLMEVLVGVVFKKIVGAFIGDKGLAFLEDSKDDIFKKLIDPFGKKGDLGEFVDPLDKKGAELGMLLDFLKKKDDAESLLPNLFEGPIFDLMNGVMDGIDGKFLESIMGKLFDKAGQDVFDALLGGVGLDVKKKLIKGFLGFIGNDVMDFLKNTEGAGEKKKLLDMLTGLGGKGAIDHFLKDPKGFDEKKKMLVLLFGEAMKKIMLLAMDIKGDPILHKLVDPLALKDDPLHKLLASFGVKDGIEHLLDLLDLKGGDEKKKIIDLFLGFKGKDVFEHFLKDHKGLDLKGKFLKLLLIFAGKDAMDFLKDPKGADSMKKMMKVLFGEVMKKIFGVLFGFRGIDGLDVGMQSFMDEKYRLIGNLMDSLGIKGKIEKIGDPLGIKGIGGPEGGSFRSGIGGDSLADQVMGLDDNGISSLIGNIFDKDVDGNIFGVLLGAGLSGKNELKQNILNLGGDEQKSLLITLLKHSPAKEASEKLLKSLLPGLKSAPFLPVTLK